MEIWVGREESTEFVLVREWDILLMRDENGNVVHEYFDTNFIKGSKFRLIHIINGDTRSVEYKFKNDLPQWAHIYIIKKANEDEDFFKKYLCAAESKKLLNPIIGKKVEFYNHNGIRLTGVILDKVCIPIATNPPRGYAEHDNYVIEGGNRELHIVNPINLIQTMK